MKRAKKKDILEKVADEIGGIAGIRESYSKEELIGLGKISNGILSLKKMAVLIEDRSRCVIRLESPTRQRSIQDPFLKKLDELLNDSVLDELLAPPGMTRRKRRWMPSQLLRIELLRTFRFSAWSVRDFCKYISSLMRPKF